jgi:hypothetical protein
MRAPHCRNRRTISSLKGNRHARARRVVLRRPVQYFVGPIATPASFTLYEPETNKIHSEKKDETI